MLRKAMILAAGLLLAGTLTGCGADDPDDPSVATGQGATPSAASGFDGPRFSKCMRDHGMDWFPDMASADQDVKAPDGVDEAKLKAAVEACREWAPPGASAARSKRGPGREVALKFAQCMRRNGLPDFPDPTADGNFRLGPDGDSPKYEAARQKCQSLLPKPE
jgi:hypothetical protein